MKRKLHQLQDKSAPRYFGDMAHSQQAPPIMLGGGEEGGRTDGERPLQCLQR